MDTPAASSKARGQAICSTDSASTVQNPARLVVPSRAERKVAITLPAPIFWCIVTATTV